MWILLGKQTSDSDYKVLLLNEGAGVSIKHTETWDDMAGRASCRLSVIWQRSLSLLTLYTPDS